ncbi:MAG: ATP synthase F1 subunit gamma [Firmicutes bacterium]|nr:ATP synthase F1 subunit gamma [Bacillota bacterium]
MTNARDIKRRIKSVQSTQQITKAMKMISAAKLRKSQASVQAVRPFTAKIERIIRDIGKSGVTHPYLCSRPEIHKVCYVVIGSDRGQCGGFNANLHRFLDHILEEEKRPYCLIVLGRKAKEYCIRRQYPVLEKFTEIGENPAFSQGQELARIISAGYDAGEYDQVILVYSQFKSAMSQAPIQKQLLPVDYSAMENKFDGREFIYEPSGKAILNVVVPQYVEIDVFCALQEAKASEHGARMTAMSAATDNANEMIGKLTLSLNRARQAAITTEISEIVGGAAALT